MSLYQVAGVGPPGIDGADGADGAPGAPGPTGPAGADYQVLFHHPMDAATGAFSNLGAGAVGAVSDPSYRRVANLEGVTKARMMGRIGGSLVAATKLRIQYHPGGDITVASGDSGWATLLTSAGSHTLNTLFYTAEASVPAPAQIEGCVLRAVLFDGDGAADPSMTACTVDLYTDSLTGGAAAGVSVAVAQAAHGLAVGDVARLSGTSYVKAKADTEANAEVAGIVSAVADADHFTLSAGGQITGLTGLTAGAVYYLSPTTAGALTVTEPTAPTQVSKPVLIADTSTSGLFFNMRGAIVPSVGTGGTSSSSTILNYLIAR